MKMAQFYIYMIFFVSLATVSMCDKKDEFLQSVNGCLQEVHVSEKELKDFVTFVHTAAQLTTVNPMENIKCHMKCVMEKQGILKAGVVNADVLTKSLEEWSHLQEHPAEITKAVELCSREKGTNECDTAFKVHMCLNQHKAELAAAFAADAFLI